MKIFLPILAVICSFISLPIFISTQSFGEEFKGKEVTNFHIMYEEETIEIGMIGDILLHSPMYHYADFLPSFEPIEKELSNIDFLLANQESVPAGRQFGLSGYPNFSSPSHIIRDLKRVGVDLISIANNHTLDQEEAGLLSAIQTMEEEEMPYMGAYKSVEDQQRNRIFEVKGVSIGFLNYTYGTNGHTIPKGKEHLINLIDPEKITKDIHGLKEKADIVVVSMHWGNEYELEANSTQRELAKLIAEAGGDIIFGHHPHVIQPYEKIVSSTGKETHVFYSLGNFLSAQQFDYTSIGGIGKVEVVLKKIQNKKIIQVKSPSFVPTIVVKGSPYKVYPLENVENPVVSPSWVQEHVFNQ